jgi:hypothetical protein
VEEMKRTRLFWSNGNKLTVGVGGRLQQRMRVEKEKKDRNIRLGLQNEAD